MANVLKDEKKQQIIALGRLGWSLRKIQEATRVLQRQAIEKLHDEERLSMLLPDFVNGADVGMVQRRGGLSFALKAGQSLRILGHFVRQKLQGDESVQG